MQPYLDSIDGITVCCWHRVDLTGQDADFASVWYLDDGDTRFVGLTTSESNTDWEADWDGDGTKTLAAVVDDQWIFTGFTLELAVGTATWYQMSLENGDTSFTKTTETTLGQLGDDFDPTNLWLGSNEQGSNPLMVIKQEPEAESA